MREGIQIKPLLSGLFAVAGVAMLVVATLAAPVSAAKAPNGPHSTRSLRGGTLRVNASNVDVATDPGLAYDTLSWSMLYTVQLLLVNYPEQNGPAGGELYPEAATSFPIVSIDGRTYTFHIRPGLKFSDGSPVTAAAYQRAWERCLTPKMGSPLCVNDKFQSVIVGAQAFLDGKTQKIAGITAKDLTITFHLTKPNAAFTAYLGMQWFGAVKPNTRYTKTGLTTFPSAGPYYIQSREVGRSLVEARNPFYKGSRPANPDKIFWSVGTDSDQSLLQVKAGQVDLDAVQPPPTSNAQLAAEYGINKTRFFVSPTTCIIYLVLNTSRPPFSNVAYRKAVNWALDRPALVRLYGKYGARRADQILVPGIPGYKPYNLYAIRGANIAEARKHAPNGIPGTIKFLLNPTPLGTNVAQVVAYDLARIGARTTENRVPSDSLYYQVLGTRGVDMDIARAGWCADYFDPFNYININLDGRTIRAKNNVNFAYLYSPKLDKQMDRAASLTGGARTAAYAALDREIMARYAPWVPIAVVNGVFFVSARVRNYVYSSYFGEPDYNALAVSPAG
jgi:peptide/nickel transport system substrate-binding protein